MKSVQNMSHTSMKPQASNLKPQQVFMLLAVGCHLAHVHCPQSMQHGMLPLPSNQPATCRRLTSPFEFAHPCFCNPAASQHPILLRPRVSSILGPFEFNQQHVWRTATRQHPCRPSCKRTATHTRQQQLVQCPAIILPRACSCRHDAATLLSTATRHPLQLAWAAPMTASLLHSATTWRSQHMQQPGLTDIRPAALFLGVGSLGSAPNESTAPRNLSARPAHAEAY